MIKKAARLTGIASSVVCATLVAANAEAQETKDNVALEEIVVTAQKRAENLQKTPLAVSALSADTIEQKGISDVSTLMAAAPNLSITTTGASTANVALYIRGIGEADSALTADSPVALYVDGIILGRSTGAVFDLVDLERVEVLRGPQGTLYGRNTTGGAVNLISKKPGNRFAVEQMFSAGNYGMLQSKTSIDTGDWGNSGLRARFTYLHKQRGGIVDNTFQSDKNDPGAYNVDAFRVAVNYDSGGRFRADYSFDFNDRRSVSHAGQVVVARPDILAYLDASPALGGQPPLVSESRLSRLSLEHDGPIKDRVFGHNLTVEIDVADGLTLRSLTGYRKWTNDVVNDQGGNGGLVGFVADPSILAGGAFQPLGVQPISLFYLEQRRRQHQFSQEVNLLGTIGSGIEFVVGAYYFNEVAKDNENFHFTVILPSPDPIEAAPGIFVNSFGVNASSGDAYRYESSSSALFGQVKAKLTDRLSLTGGLRYTIDTKDFDQAAPIIRSDSRKFKKLNWSVALDYQLTDDVLLYGRVATGYKAGGFNARATGNNTFNPENLTSYELGIKSEFFDRRLRFNAAAFHAELKDIQRTQFVAGTGGAISSTVNAGSARFDGVEAEIVAAIAKGVTIGGNFGYVHRKFKDFLFLDPATDDIIDISGIAKFNFSPSTTLNAYGQWDIAQVGTGKFSARVDYSYRSRIVWTVNPLLSPFQQETGAPPTGLVDARLSVSEIRVGQGTVTLSAWVKNLANVENRIGGVDYGALGFGTVNYGEPRTWGIDIRSKF